MHRSLTIAIDGPAGAGKSTVARLLARRLGYLYIDSGAMYRAVALKAQRLGVEPADADAIAALARISRIGFLPGDAGEMPRIMLDGEEVTAAIRSVEISDLASRISTIPGVRTTLVAQQQALGAHGGVVMEGRDIGTVVFPGAEFKVFLTASAEERAVRRHHDLISRGNAAATLEQVRDDLAARDLRDATRSVAPLVAASDAVEILSDGRSPAEIVNEILRQLDRRERSE